MFTLNVSDGAGFTPRKVVASLASPLVILIVEDDEADAYLIKRLLTEHPRIERVIRAVDGVEALCAPVQNYITEAASFCRPRAE